jgi:hypothetical protein
MLIGDFRLPISLCEGYPLRSILSPPARRGLRVFLIASRGGGVLTRETETRDPDFQGRREGGGGARPLRSPSNSPGGLKYDQCLAGTA